MVQSLSETHSIVWIFAKEPGDEINALRRDVPGWGEEGKREGERRRR
jgi:hypothetical protein